MLPLFQAFPQLARSLPHLPLANLPTPVEAMDIDIPNLHVKRDDACATLYGGNKVRKLEFFLGYAKEQGYTSTITYGCVGSNHALATALHAQARGLRPISVLFPQPIAQNVRRNLLRHFQTGARLEHCRSGSEAAAATRKQFRAADERDGPYPFVIAAGGSAPLGIAGFVNAAFELKQQIESGEVPKPDVIYVPSGTMGTAIGLLLGLQAAQLDTHVMAVAVTVPPWTSEEKARTHFQAANRFLHENDPAFPLFEFPENRFTLRHGFLGPQYGEYTPEGLDAVRRAAHAGIKLEGTYTGKSFAALLQDAAEGKLAGKTTLFWNTYNSVDIAADVGTQDYRALPEVFHPYFEQPLQALDK